MWYSENFSPKHKYNFLIFWRKKTTWFSIYIRIFNHPCPGCILHAYQMKYIKGSRPIHLRKAYGIYIYIQKNCKKICFTYFAWFCCWNLNMYSIIHYSQSIPKKWLGCLVFLILKLKIFETKTTGLSSERNLTRREWLRGCTVRCPKYCVWNVELLWQCMDM